MSMLCKNPPRSDNTQFIGYDMQLWFHAVIFMWPFNHLAQRLGPITVLYLLYPLRAFTIFAANNMKKPEDINSIYHPLKATAHKMMLH